MKLNSHILGAIIPRCGFIAAALLLWLGATSSHAISIPGTTAWTDTGIFVPSGTILDILASGTVRYGPVTQQVTGPNGTNYDGTQFFATAVLPTTTVVSLIGKIGGTTMIGTGTPVPGGLAGNGVGFVGSSYSQFISTGGELFLGFNDQISIFGDNSGSFSATVTVPEPSSAALAGIGALAVVTGFLKRRSATKKW
jgi:hypothetical protein